MISPAHERIAPRRAAAVRSALLRWYESHRRDLPWRRETDPYRIWVSEVMLQQTRVGTVAPYYERWLARFPTVRALADATDEEVLRAWAGLGYYRRARALLEAARVVRDQHDANVPDQTEELRALPGVGAYTAGAIASIAFGRAEAAVDVNARRVLTRFFDLDRPTARSVEALAAALVAPDRPGEFNQALMELGATVCAPREPKCHACPLARWCLARARGTVAQRTPARSRGPAPEYRVGTAVVVAGARVVVARRPIEGLLGGMWELPGAIAGPRESPSRVARRVAAAILGREVGAPAPIGIVDHAYSHRRHVYHAFRFDIDAPRGAERVAQVAAPAGAAAWTAVEWRDLSALESLPMGAAQRRIARALA